MLIVSWNIYTPQVLGDLDGDGVAEVLVPHGGQVVTNSDVIIGFLLTLGLVLVSLKYIIVVSLVHENMV